MLNDAAQQARSYLASFPASAELFEFCQLSFVSQCLTVIECRPYPRTGTTLAPGYRETARDGRDPTIHWGMLDYREPSGVGYDKVSFLGWATGGASAIHRSRKKRVRRNLMRKSQMKSLDVAGQLPDCT